MERKQAAIEGLSTYNTGRECSKGHLADRYTASGACLDCVKGYGKQYQAATIRRRLTGMQQYTHKQVHKDDFAALDAYVMALTLQRQAARDAAIDMGRTSALAKIGDPIRPGAPPVIDGFTPPPWKKAAK